MTKKRSFLTDSNGMTPACKEAPVLQSTVGVIEYKSSAQCRLNDDSCGGSRFTSSRESKEKLSKSLRRCPTVRQEVRLSTWFRLVRSDVLNWWFKFYIPHRDGSPLTAPLTMLARWVSSCTTNRRLFLHGRHVTKDVLVIGKRVDLIV